MNSTSEKPHGDTMYSYGCKCEICMQAQREYRRKWRKANMERLRLYERQYWAKKRAEKCS